MLAKANLSTALLLAAATSLAAFEAAAHDTSGFYSTIYVGPSFLPSTNLTETRSPGTTASGDARFDTGVGVGGAFGYRYGNGLAAEIAFDYRTHGLKSIGGTTADGDFASKTVFLNGYYRFAKWNVVRPFVGAGLGWTPEIDFDINRDGRSLSYSRSGALALQGIVGGEVELTERWSLVGDLRIKQIGSGSFKSENAGAASAISGDLDYRPISANLGLSYRF